MKAEVNVVKQRQKAARAARKAMTPLQKKMDEARSVFELFDTDGSNSIDIDEFRALCNELAVPMTEADLQHVCVRARSRWAGLI